MEASFLKLRNSNNRPSLRRLDKRNSLCPRLHLLPRHGQINCQITSLPHSQLVEPHDDVLLLDLGLLVRPALGLDNLDFWLAYIPFFDVSHEQNHVS